MQINNRSIYVRYQLSVIYLIFFTLLRKNKVKSLYETEGWLIDVKVFKFFIDRVLEIALHYKAISIIQRKTKISKGRQDLWE